MLVKELIAELAKRDPKSEIVLMDPEHEEYEVDAIVPAVLGNVRTYIWIK
jgi:hypothetical protein